MKNLLTLLSLMAFANVLNAQIDLKVYAETNYYQSKILAENDTAYYFQKDKNLQISPSLGIAFNQRNKNFHQLSFLYFQRQVQDYVFDNSIFPNQDTETKTTRIIFSYAYNIALWRTSKKWLPFIGIGTEISLRNSKTENRSSIIEQKNFIFSSSINTNLGLQYTLNERFRLELSSTINFYNGFYSRQSIKSTNVKEPTIRRYADIMRIPNEHLFQNIPIRFGLAVRI